MPLKLEKHENPLSLQNHFTFTLTNLVKYVKDLWKRFYFERYIFGIYKDNEHI